jgi:predicted enzyme related to lactoylglutathione lyase
MVIHHPVPRIQASDGAGGPYDRAMAPPMQFEHCRPSIEVGDLAAALAFLTDVVGFTVFVVEGEPPVFAIVGEDAAQIGLVEVDGPARPDGAACYVTMRGLDELIERLAEAGVPLDVPLTERPWGLRDIVVTLPGDGPMLAFGEHIGP